MLLPTTSRVGKRLLPRAARLQGCRTGTSSHKRHMVLAVLLGLALMVYAGSDSSSTLSSGSSADKPSPRVWLYLGTAAHFNGAAAQLQHFLLHYLKRLKFPKETFLLTLNYQEKSSVHAEAEYARVQEVARAWDVPYKVSTENYTSAQHNKERTTLFHERGVALEDWIAIADADELHEYPTDDITDFVRQLDRDGVNVVRGKFLDRVTIDGSLPDIDFERSIEEQFPLKCDVIRKISKGWTIKNLMAKSYFRAQQGNHYAIDKLEIAHDNYDSIGVYGITPYGMHEECYTGSTKPLTPESPCGSSKYKQVFFKDELYVHHYKWHKGVIESAERRLKYFRGDDQGGVPRTGFWRESDRLVSYLASRNNTLDVQALGCVPAREQQQAGGGGVQGAVRA